MWVFFRDGFVSVVAHRDRPDHVVVRGRFPGDVARFLGVSASKERVTPTHDYRYRVEAHRDVFAEAMKRAAYGVTYENFKDSIRPRHMHGPAMETWGVWWDAQSRYHAQEREEEVPGDAW